MRRRTSPMKRILLLVGGLATFGLFCAMVFSYQARIDDMDTLRVELKDLNTAYYAESMYGNELTSALGEANTDAFIERVARREYGYTRTGEIHYKVSNLPTGAE